MTKVVVCTNPSATVGFHKSLVLPSWLVSKAQDRYHDSLLLSLASLSYFSNVLLSTIPVKAIICPPIVDFPASINTFQLYNDANKWKM